MQPAVCKILEAAKIPHYDFRNPEPGDNGFRWTDVGKEMKPRCRCSHRQTATHRHGFCSEHAEPLRAGGICDCPKVEGVDPSVYLEALEHPLAWSGFTKDFEAMHKADTFVLVLPCGRSAHLELGWAVGAGKRTAVLLDDPVTPELMYKMVDYLATSMMDLLGWLGVRD